jgi:precorrin-6B methylase 2
MPHSFDAAHTAQTAHTAQLACELLRIHELLLRDAPRNRPFHRALAAHVTPDSAVLDIGSGSGLWAITAALLGARKVVAIEMMPMLVGLIKALARDHGVADRVEVIQGDSRQIPLAREFDIVVSETIGHVIFDEQIVEIMADARARFLKPGGVLIPDTATLKVAGAHLRQPARLPAGIPGKFGRFSSLLLHGPLALTDKKPLKLLTPPATLVHADLMRLTADPPLGDLTAHWPQQDTARINCFAVWAEMTLTNGIAMSTLDTPSWSVTAYRVKPFAQKHGDLTFRLALTAHTNHWSATLASAAQHETQKFSPDIAAAELLALNAADPDVFEKMKRLGLAGLSSPAPFPHP